MESRMEESILNHSVAISRIEDCEDNMNVCKNDVDTLRLEQVSMGRDVQMLEASMGSVHKELENLGSRMDGCVAAGRRTASLVEGNARFLATVRSGQVEVRELAEDLNRKFVRINEVIDKKMVRQDEGAGQGGWACWGED
jgi:chromosome segregation ATPase